jgi:quercetin dioxygenase-like cupin family protein
MDRFRLVRSTMLLAICALLFPGSATGDDAPPKENRNFKAPVLASLELGPEIEGMQGRQLRMRLLTIEPGGAIAIHPHKDRPTVVHLLHGSWTERREGGWVKEHHEGESWAEGKETTHWADNHGSVPAVAIAVDVFKP